MSEEYKDRIVELESVAQTRLDAWRKANEIIEELRAEIERLREIIRKVEWGETVVMGEEGWRACVFCKVEEDSAHQDFCPFYQWEGDAP